MAFDIMNLTAKEIEKIQYDILYSSIEENGYMAPSTIEQLNKNLNTTNKRIVKAINEVLSKANAARDTIDDFRDRFNNIIGNEIANPDYLTNLNKVGKNMFEAIYNIYEENLRISEIVNNIDGVSDFSNLIEKVNKLEELINSLDLTGITNCIIEKIPFENIVDNSFTISYNPISKSAVNVIINGITYCGSDDAININDNNVTWMFTSENNGFEIDENDSVQVQYNYIMTNS